MQCRGIEGIRIEFVEEGCCSVGSHAVKYLSNDDCNCNIVHNCTCLEPYQ